MTGKLALNASGDRAYASYESWSVCANGSSAFWKRTRTYVATAPAAAAS